MRFVLGLALCFGILFYLGVNTHEYAFSTKNSVNYYERGPLTGEIPSAEPRSFFSNGLSFYDFTGNANAQADCKQDSPKTFFISFISKSTAVFERVTAQNIGRRLAIVLDNVILSASIINEKLSNGKLIAAGNFIIPAAQGAAVELSALALPRPFTILESRIIAPAAGKGVGS